MERNYALFGIEEEHCCFIHFIHLKITNLIAETEAFLARRILL